jgi:hypothetical protein
MNKIFKNQKKQADKSPAPDFVHNHLIENDRGTNKSKAFNPFLKSDQLETGPTAFLFSILLHTFGRSILTSFDPNF